MPMNLAKHFGVEVWVVKVIEGELVTICKCYLEVVHASLHAVSSLDGGLDLVALAVVV